MSDPKLFKIENLDKFEKILNTQVNRGLTLCDPETLLLLIYTLRESMKVNQFYANIDNFTYIQTDLGNIYLTEDLPEGEPIPKDDFKSYVEKHQVGNKAKEFLRGVE